MSDTAKHVHEMTENDNDAASISLQELKEHIQSGCKRNENRLGIEVEHFLLHSETRRGVSYESGIESLLRELSSAFTQKYEEKGRLIELKNNDVLISIEPGGQFEISISPQKNLSDISRIYKDYRGRVSQLAKKRGFEFICMGYQPISCAEELSLLPKRRYEYMDSLFRKTGKYGVQMMRGTASTHVSIDYLNEADCVWKFRMANLLAPAFSLICDNVSAFEGKPYSGHLLRNVIWENTDPVRCGVFPDLFDECFSIHTYAKRVLEEIPRIPDFSSNVAEKTSAENCSYLLSSVFFDVRLRQYMEIRVADSMEFPYVLAYVALIKGLFYETGLSKLTKQVVFEEEAIKAAKRSLETSGYAGELYGQNAGLFCDNLFNVAWENLSPEERRILFPLKEACNSRKKLSEIH